MDKQRKPSTKKATERLAVFGRTAALVVIGIALYGGIISEVKAEIIAFSENATATGGEYFQYGVILGEGVTSDPDLGGFAVVAFDAHYDNPEIRLEADIYDLKVDTSIYPIDKFWVTYLTLENEDGDIEKIWDNNTPSLKVGDILTGKISIENRIGDSVYAPLTLNVLGFDLSGNENGVADILCSYEVDTDQDGWIDLTGSILVSDAIENYGGELASWQQLCMADFDYRAGHSFATLTFEAMPVPEPSIVALIVAGVATAGVGAGFGSRTRRRSK